MRQRPALLHPSSLFYSHKFMAKKRQHKPSPSANSNGSNGAARLREVADERPATIGGKALNKPAGVRSEGKVRRGSESQVTPRASDGNSRSDRGRSAGDNHAQARRALAVTGARNITSRPTHQPSLLAELKTLGEQSGKAIANTYARFASALLVRLEKIEDANAERTLRRRVHSRPAAAAPKPQTPPDKSLLPPK